ncbi:molybdenum cofactor sulfurase [Starkeya sp. 3C]|uniref:Molybdenum cofactor sulfurase n=1 Tax=Ancylobacter moscoviensis TaxID=2597768 RepID=A0ABY3DS62_9HYPH|nr:MOSC domain-containing protein [Ancylobacter moscoviensis]TSJ62873.1 molybdenum cofactor sulfurase [Ancylobacter moscoviensis]
MTVPSNSPGADLFGEPVPLPPQRFEARLAGTLIADGAGFETRAVPSLSVTLEGVPGDRHAGHARPADSRVPWYPRGTPIRNARQLSIVAPDELAEIARRLGVPEVRPEWIGANLVIEGVSRLTRLPPGTRLHFAGGAALAVEGENAPCRHAGRAVGDHFPSQEELDLAFVRAAKGLRGLVAWVERAGDLLAGTGIDVRVPEQRLWTR